ncbi:CcdB family protein [Phenylobacterium sp.]|uniref:CcdB family protein n=1 Tax=Phenylobacterium sp. TaxID=1871053 RepID=UPI00289D0D0F|nr:CcdB family protein [Phenylobacterium sp.]
MRQFEVYPNPSPRSRSVVPFVVVLQSHLLAAAPTTLVAPLIVDDGRSGYSEISALVPFDGRRFIVLVAELGAVDTRLLTTPLGDLSTHEDAIRRALDRLFTGF